MNIRHIPLEGILNKKYIHSSLQKNQNQNYQNAHGQEYLQRHGLNISHMEFQIKLNMYEY